MQNNISKIFKNMKESEIMFNIISAHEVNAAKPDFDAAHDFNHHEAVFNNAVGIVEREELTEEDIDPKALFVAIMAHDLDRDDDENNKNWIADLVGDEDLANRVWNIVSVHSFGKGKQTNINQKILFDADKLEYISKERFEDSKQAVLSGKMAKDLLEEHIQTWNYRIGDVKNMLNFDSTINIWNERMDDLRKYLVEDDFWKDIKLPEN